ncbi:Histone-lysine N-methyltransferase PRDM9, partial [Paragonimus heterotremus]
TELTDQYNSDSSGERRESTPCFAIDDPVTLSLNGSEEVRQSETISLEYCDSAGNSPYSGDEQTSDAHSVDIETARDFNQLFEPKNLDILPECPRKDVFKGAVMKTTLSEEGRRYPLREKNAANYSTAAQTPEDDRFLYCYVCNISVINGCLKHPIEWVENTPVTPCDGAKDHDVYFQMKHCVCGSPYYLHASRTAPRDWVLVFKSGIRRAGFGVWANKNIKCGTTFGPYDGVVVNLDEIGDDEFARRSRGGYAWLVRNNLEGVKSHLVDARNPLRSNWLRFVNCARYDEEQNLVTIQYRGKIYYRACQDIARGSELLTYYGTEFANELESKNNLISPNGPMYHFENGDYYTRRPALKKSLSKEKSNVCEFCKKGFTRYSDLQRHVNAIHLKEKAYVCDFCDKVFTQRCDRQRHTNAIHLKEKLHVCEFCGKHFADGSHLHGHVNSIHLKEKSYVCEFCDKDFTRSSDLRRHVNAIHLQKKPHVCQFCGKGFTRGGDLRRHVDVIHLKKKTLCNNVKNASSRTEDIFKEEL